MLVPKLLPGAAGAFCSSRWGMAARGGVDPRFALVSLLQVRFLHLPPRKLSQIVHPLTWQEFILI